MNEIIIFFQPYIIVLYIYKATLYLTNFTTENRNAKNIFTLRFFYNNNII